MKKIAICRRWHKNGQLGLEYSETNGKRNGLLRGWDHRGRLLTEEVYVMGKPQLIRKFSVATGRLSVEVVSDGAASCQRTYNSRKKKYQETFLIKGKVVTKKEYLAFIKQ